MNSETGELNTNMENNANYYLETCRQFLCHIDEFDTKEGKSQFTRFMASE